MTAILEAIRVNSLDSFEMVEAFFSAAPLHLHVGQDEKKNLYLLKYDQIRTDFSLPAAREARGIILDKETNRVVCYPFSKFFNVGEKYAAKIDWSTAVVQHKYDGSIIKIYWYQNGGEAGRWIVATNGTIDACQVPADTGTGKTFYDLFLDAAQFCNFSYDRLSKDYTYMLELMHPQNIIVVRYTEPKLIHIGTRNNQTFEESYEYIGVDQAETFDLKTLEQCVEAASMLGPMQEGFVVKDAQYRRVKIKGPIYLQLHHMLTDKNLAIETIAVRVFLEGQRDEVEAYASDERIAIICEHFVLIEKKLDTLCQRLQKIWLSIVAQRPATRKDIAVASKKESGIYFSLMMARASHESDTEKEMWEPLLAFFRQQVLAKHGKDAQEFLNFISLSG